MVNSNNVGGAMDRWDFRRYILGILFYRFISENMVGFLWNFSTKQNMKLET